MLKTRLTLICIFYRSFAAFSGLISMASWGMVHFPLGERFWRFLPLYVILKIVSDTLIWYRTRRYDPGSLFFYSNKGISERALFLSAFLLDIVLFLGLVAFAGFFI